MFCPDAEMKVSEEILRRVYESLQDQGNDSDEVETERIDPDNHLFFIDAFEMPLWHWSQERGTFEKCVIVVRFWFLLRLHFQSSKSSDDVRISRISRVCYARSTAHHQTVRASQWTFCTFHIALTRSSPSGDRKWLVDDIHLRRDGFI